MEGKILEFFIYYPVFLISLTIHEFSHSWMALRKGDDTAKFMGRLTLNPLPHLDPIGTVILPIFTIFFGGIYFAWAKPVPVNPLHFRNARTDMFWVSLAGPMSNFLFSILCAVIYGLTVSFGDRVMDPTMKQIFLDLSNIGIDLNLALFFFNLIPLSPLDGAKIFGRFLPAKIASQLDMVNPMTGGMIILALMVSGILKYLAIPIYLVGGLLKDLFIF